MNNISLIGAKLLDGTKNMVLQENMTVIVKDGKIVKVGKGLEPEKDTEVIDLKGAYLCPGLINMHVHLAASGKPPKANAKPVDYKKLFDTLTKFRLVVNILLKSQEGRAKQELYSGVTTIRTVGGILDLDGKVRDRINSGKIEGPTILAANTAVTVPGGHFAGSLATEASTPEMAAEHVRKIAETKPDLIKLMITGGVMDSSADGEPGVLRMPPEIVKAACDEAHKLGYKVAAHIESPEGVRVALENGVDTVEHGAKPDDEIIRLFKEKKAADICTISPALPYAEFDLSVSHASEIGRKNGIIVMQGIIDCAKVCIENDIPVGMGTDTGCPFITNYNMWRELGYFTKYLGVSPEFALYTATLRNAEIAGISDRVGSIEEGKNADMIVSKENPLDNFANLSKLSYVIKGGKVIKNPKIRKMTKVDFELDKTM